MTEMIEYIEIEGVSVKTLDYMLVMQFTEKGLRELVKSSDSLQRRLGFSGFRPKNIPTENLYASFTREVGKDFRLFNMMAENWLGLWKDDYEICEDKNREEIIENITEVIEELGFIGFITYVRLIRDDLHPLIPPLLKEWVEVKNEDFPGELGDNVKLFSEEYGVTPFEEEQDKLEKDIETPDLDELSLNEVLDQIEGYVELAREKTGKSGNEEEYKKALAEIEELNRKLENKDKTIVSYQRKEHDYEDEIAELQDKLSEVNKEKGDLGHIIGELRKEKENLEKEVVNIENKLKRNDKEKANLKGRIDEKENELTDSFQRIEALEERLEELKEKNEKTDKKLERKREKYREVKESLQKTEDKLNTKDEKIESIKQDRDKQINKIKSTHKDEKVQLNNQITQLKNEIKQLKESKEKVRQTSASQNKPRKPKREKNKKPKYNIDNYLPKANS